MAPIAPPLRAHLLQEHLLPTADTTLHQAKNIRIQIAAIVRALDHRSIIVDSAPVNNDYLTAANNQLVTSRGRCSAVIHARPDRCTQVRAPSHIID